MLLGKICVYITNLEDVTFYKKALYVVTEFLTSQIERFNINVTEEVG